MSGKVVIENLQKNSVVDLDDLTDGMSFMFDNSVYIVNKYENMFAFSICGRHIITKGDLSLLNYKSAKLINLRVIVE